METKQKRSRFITQPSGRNTRITAHDVAVLMLLQRYRYLPSNYIAALLGWSGDYHKKVLRKLRHDLGLLECPNPSWAAANAYYRPAVYGITRSGEEELKKRGLYAPHPKTGHEFNHELMVCLIRASFELGAAEHGLTIISKDDILDHPTCPKERRSEANPWSIPVRFIYNGQEVRQDIESDGEFFGLSAQRDGSRLSLMFPGFEADRRTEPLEPESYDRSSIKKKLVAYRAVASQRLYQTRYGLPNALVPFITINEAHKRAIMRVLDTLTEGKGSKLFLFKSIPNFASFESFPPATGHMVSEPWERAGHPPLCLVDELKGVSL